MNFRYYLYKHGTGYLTKEGGHTDTPSNALTFYTYLEASDYKYEHSLSGYQIIELI